MSSNLQQFTLYLNLLTKNDYKYDNVSKRVCLCKTIPEKLAEVKQPRRFPANIKKEENIKAYYRTLLDNTVDNLHYPNTCIHELGEGDPNDKTLGIPSSYSNNTVSRVRCLVVDIDEFISLEVYKELLTTLNPTFVVETSTSDSGSKYHFYFIVPKDAEYESDLLENAKYSLYQIGLAKTVDAILGSEACDKGLTDYARGLRTPGFLHRKDPESTHVVRVIFDSGPDLPKTLDALEKFLTDIGVDLSREAVKELSSNKVQFRAEGGNLLVSEVKDIEKSERNNALFKYALFTCFRQKKMTVLEARGAAIAVNQMHCKPPLDQSEVVDIVSSAHNTFLQEFTNEQIAYAQQNGAEFLQPINSLRFNTKEFSYDWSKLEQHTPILSDEYMIAMFRQKYGNDFLSTGKKGTIWQYNEPKGVWETGFVQAGECFTDVVNDQINSKHFKEIYTNKGKFDKKSFVNFFTTRKSIGKKNTFLENLCNYRGFAFEGDEGFDKDNYVLNCKNCYIDLRTFEPKPHDRLKYFTKQAPINFDNDKEAIERYRKLDTLDEWKRDTLWTKALADIFSEDMEMMKFFQRLCGYLLYGGNPEDYLIFLYGGGSNGKSVIEDVLYKILGGGDDPLGYCGTVRAEMLMNTNSSDLVTLSEISDLRGRRLAITTDTNDKSEWNEGQLKSITGDSIVKSKRYHQDPESIQVTWSVVVASNHFPKVNGTDYGIWRRMLTVPFKRNFREEGIAVDKPKLVENIVKDSSSILAWMLAGAIEYNEMGLASPEPVTALLKQYKLQMNPVSIFLEDCTEKVSSPEQGDTLADLHSVYNRIWANESQSNPMNKDAFKADLSRSGINPKLINVDGVSVPHYNYKLTKDWRERLDNGEGSNVTKARFG